VIKIVNRQKKIALDTKNIQNILQAMISSLGYDDFDIAIVFTTNATVRKYNRDFRDKDKPTDVLSFPFHPDLEAGKRIKIKHPDDKNLGDIIISLEYLQKDCSRWNRTFFEHLIAILAHGVAHLLNYDHQTDEEFEVMQKIEKKLLKAITSK
jgi:rRNA maturation RNase YbeY